MTAGAEALGPPIGDIIDLLNIWMAFQPGGAGPSADGARHTSNATLESWGGGGWGVVGGASGQSKGSCWSPWKLQGLVQCC